MTRLDKRASNRADKQERIRAAALALFEERGFAETTTRAIAERAGIATGTLFLYAPTKELLLVHLFREEVEGVQLKAFATLPAKASLHRQLRHVFGAMFRFYAQRPALSRVFVRELLFLQGEAAEVHKALLYAFAGRLAELLSSAQDKGELADAVPPMLLATNAFAVYLLQLIAFLNGGHASLEDALDALEAALAAQLPRARAGSTRKARRTS
jgi:TetR/AcrR family transcriptional regulator, cholesterol catabolism regulator